MRPCFVLPIRNTRSSLARIHPVSSLRQYASSSTNAAELQFGQPLHETHPHLLQAGELTPGITALEYAQRRFRLAAKLPNNGVAVLSAATLKYRSGAVFYEFSQDSNFFYLTGFDEPSAVAVIRKGSEKEDHTFHLFVRSKDAAAEMWEGARSGLQAATDVFNADETGDVNSISTLLPPLLSEAKSVYADVPRSISASGGFLERLLPKASSSSSNGSDAVTSLLSSRKVEPLSDLIYPLRNMKSPAEIALMRRAGRATGRAFQKTMAGHWDRERHLSASIQHAFVRHGCDRSAYQPVVAGGRNALAVHYTRNEDVLRDGDLVLVDAGGETGHYVADVTRTFPVGKAFAPAQRDLYAAVLAVQRSCVALCRADAGMSLDQVHAVAEQRLVEHLGDLGFDMERKDAIGTLFPHHVGHYIGLDVHDTPGVSRREPLRAGQCVTVEPSVHVPFDDRWPVHFQGLGVQVEDSVAVGEEHPLLLSAEAPKEIADIEVLRAKMLDTEPGGR